MPEKNKMDKITQHHLRNLAFGNAVKNDNGTISTVFTVQFDEPDGSVIVVPSVWDGKVLDPLTALKRAKKENVFELFESRSQADAFDRMIHEKNKFLGGRMKPISSSDALDILGRYGLLKGGLLD
tara:strand:+ start:382 stop:756 length:375 start_codon:yes stop_codon:yes gene_type:complete